jgi:hypothetical protein
MAVDPTAAMYSGGAPSGYDDEMLKRLQKQMAGMPDAGSGGMTGKTPGPTAQSTSGTVGTQMPSGQFPVNVPTAPAAPAPVRSEPLPQATATAAPKGDQTFLDWAGKTYGISKARGGGFSDLPQGTSLEQVIQRYNTDTGANAKYLGGPSGDRADFGEGQSDALTAGGQIWSDFGGRNGGGAPGGGAGVGGDVALGGGGGSPAYADGMSEAIQRLLKRGEAPITGDDPSIAAQFLPQRNALERGAQLARAAAAQRGAVTGTNIGGAGGALDAEVNSINEDVGAKSGELMGELVGRELAGRRGDVVNAIQFAQGEERLALQKQLQDIDAQLRQQGLDLQGRSLNNQNAQFYDTMGYNAGRDEYLFNQLYGQGLGA